MTMATAPTQNSSSSPSPIDDVYYPESDGRPMADNDLHAISIGYIYDAMKAWRRDRRDVFVANNILWYYEEGNNKARINPDVLVAFGVSAEPRGTYRQWVHGVAPQVVFEVISPVNEQQPPVDDISSKFSRYMALGVDEYVVYRPPYGRFEYWEHLSPIADLHGFMRDENGIVIPFVNLIGSTSRRLGITYTWCEDDELPLRLVAPSGEPLLQHVDVVKALDAERVRADAERVRADAERARADAALDRLRAAGIDVSDLGG